jgi:hypothetical protein
MSRRLAVVFVLIALASSLLATPAGAAKRTKPLPSIAVNDVAAGESLNVALTVRLSATSTAPVTVAYATAPGSASTDDYVSTSGTLTVPPGVQSVLLGVDLVHDGIDEADEQFTVQLSSPANATIADGTGVITILDDDAPLATRAGSEDASTTDCATANSNGTCTASATADVTGDAFDAHVAIEAPTLPSGGEGEAVASEVLYFDLRPPAGKSSIAVDATVLVDRARVALDPARWVNEASVWVSLRVDHLECGFCTVALVGSPVLDATNPSPSESVAGVDRAITDVTVMRSALITRTDGGAIPSGLLRVVVTVSSYGKLGCGNPASFNCTLDIGHAIAEAAAHLTTLEIA